MLSDVLFSWHILGDRLIPLAPLSLVGFYMKSLTFSRLPCFLIPNPVRLMFFFKKRGSLLSGSVKFPIYNHQALH